MSYLPQLTDLNSTLGDVLRIGIRKGLIKLPQDMHTPVICIGPGTGVAPMKAIIEERVHAGSSGASPFLLDAAFC